MKLGKNFILPLISYFLQSLSTCLSYRVQVLKFYMINKYVKTRQVFFHIFVECKKTRNDQNPFFYVMAINKND